MRNDRQVYFSGSFTGHKAKPAKTINSKSQAGFNVFRLMGWAFGLSFAALTLAKYI